MAHKPEPLNYMLLLGETEQNLGCLGQSLPIHSGVFLACSMVFLRTTSENVGKNWVCPRPPREMSCNSLPHFAKRSCDSSPKM